MQAKARDIMNTKKLKTFEYAGKVQPGTSQPEGLYRQEAFDTPLGYAIVMVHSDGSAEKEEEMVAVVTDRIRYYLEHADEDAIHELPGNALLYSSSYLYQHGRRKGFEIAGKISGLCLLFHQEKLYYSWIGDQICMSLWDGKRLHTLVGSAGVNTGDDIPDGVPGAFMGERPDLRPETVSEPLTPLSGDVLLMGSGSFCHAHVKKEVKKILQDSMPLQTKLLRIIGQSGRDTSPESISVMLVSFYHVKNEGRSFIPGKSKEPVSSPGPSLDTLRMNISKKKAGTQSSNILKYVMIALLGVIAGYMVYDLFIYDPKPAIRIPPPSPAALQDTVVSYPEGEPPAEYDEPPAMPDDVVYTVRGGDTWGRIYRQYGVCSWFIINHPRNTGRFGRDGGLIAGQQLRIPVRYSGDPEYNPYYYKEFTTDIVGGRCENAGQELLDRFHEKYESR